MIGYGRLPLAAIDAVVDQLAAAAEMDRVTAVTMAAVVACALDGSMTQRAEVV